ncbi:MAG: MFS transporter [Planctomycetes bacterium]|nr:MFS transporter [Planctomycetota bacterium]
MTETTAADAHCPLSVSQQTRNLLIFGANISLIFLGAPVLYVGIGQGALCQRLQASETIANLPTTMYFWMTPLPILVAWYFFQARLVKPVLVTTFLTVAAGSATVAGAILLTQSREIIITLVVIHSGMLGCALGVVANFQWEVLGRGVTPSRRGQALSLAFGAGPILAFASSLGAQAIIDNIEYPWSFATLFGATAPITGLAAFLASRFVVPLPEREPPRPGFVRGIFGGLGDYLSHRPILFAAMATLLVSCGYNVFTNLGLYTKIAVGTLAEEYLGYQSALRFGCKALAGGMLGILTRNNPKVGMLATTAFCLASVIWVALAPDIWFLLSFGLMGMGELWGVYFPNYILSCSEKDRMRRNMAFTSMLYFPSGFAPIFYGYITTRIGDEYGKRVGFEASFMLSIAVLTVTLLLILIALPMRPPRRTVVPIE